MAKEKKFKDKNTRDKIPGEGNGMADVVTDSYADSYGCDNLYCY